MYNIRRSSSIQETSRQRMLKSHDPPGVQCFKSKLRPYFVKDATSVFLYNILQFMKFKRFCTHDEMDD